MTLPGTSRLPFLGLALASALGIALGDLIHPPGQVLTIAIVAAGVCALSLIWWPNILVTYLFVCCSFLLVHNLRTSATPGLSLSYRLGERPRVITATGAMVSEPKVAENGIASFLLRLNSIELEGRVESSDATILIRWKGSVVFGDELRLFGMAAPIAPPRNPGEFDMRAYLARRDVHRVLFVRYPEDGVLLRAGGGNPILRVAQQSRNWLQGILCRGLD